jgi:hypothetical protein
MEENSFQHLDPIGPLELNYEAIASLSKRKLISLLRILQNECSQGKGRRLLDNIHPMMMVIGSWRWEDGSVFNNIDDDGDSNARDDDTNIDDNSADDFNVWWYYNSDELNINYDNIIVDADK